jgi:hypothetical protein
VIQWLPIPTSKLQGNFTITKFQCPQAKFESAVEAWAYLEVGAWNLELLFVHADERFDGVIARRHGFE